MGCYLHSLRQDDAQTLEVLTCMPWFKPAQQEPRRWAEALWTSNFQIDLAQCLAARRSIPPASQPPDYLRRHVRTPESTGKQHKNQQAGVYGNRTHWELCSNPPLVLKTRARTSGANTPELLLPDEVSARAGVSDCTAWGFRRLCANAVSAHDERIVGLGETRNFELRPGWTTRKPAVGSRQ